MDNNKLIERYNSLLKFKFENDLNSENFSNYYRGSYDFDILSKYLKKFYGKIIIIDNKNFFVKNFIIRPEISNFLSNETELENENEYETIYKLYIILYNDGNFNIKELEFSEFINSYGKDFSNEYYNILKTINFDINVRTNIYTITSIFFDICYFCDNDTDHKLFLTQSDIGLSFYTCKTCEFFAKYCITKVKNKYLFGKLRNFSKIIGKLILYYYNVMEKRYLPGNSGFYESKLSFENKLKL